MEFFMEFFEEFKRLVFKFPRGHASVQAKDWMAKNLLGWERITAPDGERYLLPEGGSFRRENWNPFSDFYQAKELLVHLQDKNPVSFRLSEPYIYHKSKIMYLNPLTEPVSYLALSVVEFYVLEGNKEQISYHLSPSDLWMLDFVEEYEGEWDGKFTGRDIKSLFGDPLRHHSYFSN
jgi:hypothetical protein